MESDYFTDSVTRNPTQAIFAPIFKDQLNCCCQIFAAFLNGSSLTVCARNLGRPADEPVAVPLDDRCEFVVHTEIIAQV